MHKNHGFSGVFLLSQTVNQPPFQLFSSPSPQKNLCSFGVAIGGRDAKAAAESRCCRPTAGSPRLRLRFGKCLAERLTAGRFRGVWGGTIFCMKWTEMGMFFLGQNKTQGGSKGGYHHEMVVVSNQKQLR